MPKNGPKDFKSMAFPPSRYGTPSSFSAVLPKTEKRFDPFKDYLNSLRCPICNGQIDGISAPYYCAADREHYQVSLFGINVIGWERVTVYDNKSRRIQITQTSQTEIVVWEAFPKEPVKFDFKVFDFSNTTREKILHRIKTILVFQ